MTQFVKCADYFYTDIKEGIKTFDIIKLERPISVGSTIIFQEYNTGEEKYTGNEWIATVTYVEVNNSVKKDHVVICFKEKDNY